MKPAINRREFSRTLALSAPVAPLPTPIPAAVNTKMGHKKLRGVVMAEMDHDGKAPFAPLDLVKIRMAYLERQGITFRTGWADTPL